MTKNKNSLITTVCVKRNEILIMEKGNCDKKLKEFVIFIARILSYT